MSRTIVVDMDRLRLLSEQMNEAAKNIAAILGELDARVSTLASRWSGEAAQSYAQAHNVWTQDLAAMNRTLDRMSAAVTVLGDRHTRREQANARVWG